MTDPKNILVIQLKRAGDVLVTTPVLSALKKAFPEASIDFLVDPPFAPLLENNPFLHAVRVYHRSSPWNTCRELRRARYDLIFDFQSSPRSILCGLFSNAGVRAGYKVTFWGHLLDRTVRRPGQGVSATEGKMSLLRSLFPLVAGAGERTFFLTDSERRWAAGILKQPPGSRHIVGLIPTHRRPSRRWSSSSFRVLAGMYAAQQAPVWLFWGPGEEDYVLDIARECPGSQMIPRTTLREMAALLEHCRLVVTNDNGPMHMAVAVGTPTVTLYGPTDPVAWNPGGPKHRALSAPGLQCLGCNLNECSFGHECMAALTPQSVFQEAEQLVRQAGVGA